MLSSQLDGGHTYCGREAFLYNPAFGARTVERHQGRWAGGNSEYDRIMAR